jgi:hypothetical protein
MNQDVHPRPRHTAAELDRAGVPVRIYHEGGTGRNYQAWTHEILAECEWCGEVAKRESLVRRVSGE